MLREPLSRRNLLSLKATIKGFSAESITLRKKAYKQPKKSAKKTMYYIDKVNVGLTSRLHCLVYAFVRGLSYKEVERATNCKLTDMDFTRMYAILKAFSPWTAYYLKEEDLKLWVNEGKQYYLTKAEMTAKIEARRTKEKEMKAAREARQC